MILIQKFDVFAHITAVDKPIGVWVSSHRFVEEAAQAFNLVKFIQPQLKATADSYLNDREANMLVKNLAGFYISHNSPIWPENIAAELSGSRAWLELYRLTELPVAESESDVGLRNSVQVDRLYTVAMPEVAEQIWDRAHKRKLAVKGSQAEIITRSPPFSEPGRRYRRRRPVRS
jgi:hypothetical protein